VSRSRIRGLLALPLLGAFGALLVWALYGLPAFGHYRGPYGNVVNRIVVPERHATNAVGTTVFDIRAVDTMGEELILFAAVVGVVMLLRRTGEDEDHGPEDPVRSVAIRVGGIVGVAVVTLVGIWLVSFGWITPGGGFQGGVVLAGAAVLVYLAGEYRAYRRVTPTAMLDLAEGVGAGTYVVVGLLALLLGHEFLTNFLPFGTAGKLSSGGTIALLNAAVALEVCGAFVLLFTEFLEELIAVEGPEGRERTRL
jgi:multicomponent Na+:H+ antiporter subunit B